MYAIFNASIREGIVPARWKEANVIPVPKVHPPQLIKADLRPISLTATLSKLLESFVGSWILDRIEDKLDKHQHGALKGRSTMHTLVNFMHHWNKAVDECKSVHAVFVDFAKAVDHNVLVARLMDYGLPHTVIWWIFLFLHLRRQRVKIGDMISGDGCWHASRIVSRAVDVHHFGR